MNVMSIEESTLKTWPTLESEIYDGWVLRFANGYTGRSNSVLPLYSSSLDLETKLNYVEAQYRQRGLPPRFRMLPESHPANLDEVLDQRGYVRNVDTWVMTLDFAEMQPVEVDAQVNFAPQFYDEWAQAFGQLNTTWLTQVDTIKQMLPRIQLPTTYAALMHKGEFAAVALAVRDGNKIGIYDVATRGDLRGQGFGKRLIGSLLAHAQQNGVIFAYLQMAADNTPAHRLYSSFGFREIYMYWYRNLAK